MWEWMKKQGAAVPVDKTHQRERNESSTCAKSALHPLINVSPNDIAPLRTRTFVRGLRVRWERVGKQLVRVEGLVHTCKYRCRTNEQGALDEKVAKGPT